MMKVQIPSNRRADLLEWSKDLTVLSTTAILLLEVLSIYVECTIQHGGWHGVTWAVSSVTERVRRTRHLSMLFINRTSRIDIEGGFP